MKNLYVLFLLLSVVSCTHNISAKTYYVDANVSNGNGSSEAPYNNITDGIDEMSPSGGDTLIIRPGIYSKSNDSMSSFVNGTPGNYNIIKAETDGTVVISTKENFLVNRGQNYLQFEGLKFITVGTNFEKAINGAHHIKVLRCAFEGGPERGNANNFAIGGYSKYILIEDSWFYGNGGRENLVIFTSSKVIIRRVVLRHDHGWVIQHGDKSEPEGVGTIYNSNEVELQNVIIIDSLSNPHNTRMGSEWVGAFTLANNANKGASCKNNNITGVIALNVEGNGFDHGGYGKIENINFQDVIVWWSKAGRNKGGGLAHSNRSFKSTTANNITIGNQTYGAAIWGGVNSKINLTNSIIYNVSFSFGSNEPSQGVIDNSYNNCYRHDKNFCSMKGKSSFNPLKNGLKYLPRIEANSKLLQAGKNKSRAGAIITNKIGVSGTLWGEPGYKIVTKEPLWPWPNENRIHKDMSNASNLLKTSPANRGFAAKNQTLTNYIWSALGNELPGSFKRK